MLSSLQSKVAPRACTLFFLPLLTLAFPLGVLLVVLQRLPAEELQLASTDARLLLPVSTFWCAAQEVSASHPFYAYKLPKAPSIVRESFHPHNLAFRFNLLYGKYNVLRYHLLTGSTMELAGCTDSYPAPFEVFYGKEAWNECLKRLQNHVLPEAFSKQSSSSSESEEDYRDLPLPRQEARWTQRKLSCPNSVLSGQLDRSLADEDPSPACPVGRYPFALTAGRSGKYYVLVRTDGRTEPGGVLLHVRLNRTTYELPDGVIVCRSPNSCAIPLTFGAEERVVVSVSEEPDAGATLFQVRSKCQPRAAFYLVVFLLLPVLFAIALVYVVRFQRRRRRNAVVVQGSGVTSREPLPPQQREDNQSAKEESYRCLSRPPSYQNVMRGRSVTPPPSYEELLRQPLVPVHRV